MKKERFIQHPKINSSLLSSRLKIAATLVLTGSVFAFPGFAQNKTKEKTDAARERKDLSQKFKAYRPIAEYQGGVFGYYRTFSGLVEREFDQLVMKNEETGKLILSLSLESIIAVCVETRKRTPEWMKVAGDIVAYGAAGPLEDVIKAKYHYLFVQYRDAETDVSGTAVFRFERLEAADSLLNQIVGDLAMIKRDSIYVRQKGVKLNLATPQKDKQEKPQ